MDSKGAPLRYFKSLFGLLWILKAAPNSSLFGRSSKDGHSEVYASIRPLYARAHSKARLLGLSGVEAVIGV